MILRPKRKLPRVKVDLGRQELKVLVVLAIKVVSNDANCFLVKLCFMRPRVEHSVGSVSRMSTIQTHSQTASKRRYTFFLVVLEILDELEPLGLFNVQRHLVVAVDRALGLAQSQDVL